MFIFDFVAETILDQILDWIYGKIIGFLNDFFVMMNNMGVELFALPWVEAVTTFWCCIIILDTSASRIYKKISGMEVVKLHRRQTTAR